MNNPFESNNNFNTTKPVAQNQTPVSKGAPSQNYQPPQTKSKSNTAIIMTIIIVLICLGGLVVTITTSSSSSIFVKTVGDREVDNYVFDENDIFDKKDFEPKTAEIVIGESFEIDANHPKFYDTNEGRRLVLVVGVDIAPGVYTVEPSGSIYGRIKTSVEHDFDIDETKLVNIPLVQGDVIEISDREGNYSASFTAQTEYVPYQRGLSGFFVYGLSYFEPNLVIADEDFSHLRYCYLPEDEKYRDCEYVYNETGVEVKSSPGAYFSVETYL